jgi:integrase/recombinase XerD
VAITMSEIGVDAAIAGYLDHVSVERGLAVNTVSAYRRDLARYSRWCRSRAIEELDRITSADVASFAASLRNPRDSDLPEESALSASSAARVVVAVRSFHRFAVLEGWTASDVATDVAPPSIPRRLPKALPYASVEAMIEASGDPATTVGSRDRALLEVLYGTGTRISEVVGLDVDDVDLDTSTLLVTGKGSKQRRLPFGDAAHRALTDYLTRGRPALASAATGARRPGAALFLGVRGSRLSRQAAWEVIRRSAVVAEVGDHVGPHTLRHSYATHLMEGGADVRVVQELLGHASVTTTQIYTLVTADALREVYAASHPRAQ